MYNKRLDFIEHIRGLSNDSEKVAAMEGEYSPCLNSIFDIHLGENLKNLCMLADSNYFDLYYDRSY
jgi:hypothetical protein